MTKPTVSALIDTYNHERYIEQAIVSVLEQDFPASDMEILVVDDGSTDRTPEIVHKFAPRVRLLRKKNGGQASAFNAGIAATDAPIVAFLDADDWWVPGKLSAVISALEREPEAAGVGHGYYEFHEATEETRICAPRETKFLSLTTPDAAHEALLAWGRLLTSAFTVRRKTLDRITPIPESLFFCADAPIALAAMAGGARLLKEPLCYYRRHSDNLDAVDPKNTAKLRRKCEMNERMFQLLERQLVRLDVPSESIAALLYPPWTDAIRLNLRTCGGSRLRAFKTEMQSFRSEVKNPTMGYLLFKYGIVGPATLLLPPRRFYQARDWYAKRNLRRFREGFCGPSTVSENPERHDQ